MADNSRRTADSSLELLLDTMCNTFGGVMFIAISLVILASMLSPLKTNTSPKDEAAEAARIRAELEVLQRELDSSRHIAAELDRVREMLKDDASAQLLEEITHLELIKEQKNLQLSLLEQQAKAFELELKALRQKRDEQQKKIAELENTLAAFKSRQTAAEQKLALLKIEQEQHKNKYQLTFATLSERNEAPYYLIIKDGKMWRVGPEEKPDGTIASPDDVTVSVSGDLVASTIRPGRGIDIFQGEDPAPEFMSALGAVPSGRIAYFLVTGSDAEVFHRLRNVFKEKNLTHGFHLMENVEPFYYKLVKNAKFEY